MKRIIPRASLTLTTLAVLLFLSNRAGAEIRYEVSLAHPEQHLFHVQMEIPDVQDEVTLQMAAWNALYQIRDFSSHVQEVEAFADGQPVNIEKLDKLTWRVRGSGTITIKYDTFWDDAGPFNSQLNSEHAFINPAMILLYVPDRRSERSTLGLVDLPAGWAAVAATDAQMLQSSQIRMYKLAAPSFDQLADAPIEVSHFETFLLHDVTPTVLVVIHGDNYKKSDVENALRKIVMYETKMMEARRIPNTRSSFTLAKPQRAEGAAWSTPTAPRSSYPPAI